jgi:tetratricopeptide (TPR) repeat protein
VDRPRADQLNDQIVVQVTELCESGDDDVEAGRYDDAVVKYRAALALVPHPVHSWAVTTWILGAIAEAYYLAEDYARARDAINEAFRCDGAIGNAFLHLRLGQTELALGNRGRALDELIRAYTRAGEDVFADEDPKYLTMVKAALDDSN